MFFVIKSVDLIKSNLISFTNFIRDSFLPLYLKCICPVFILLIILDLNPPLSNQNFDELDNAATTELSSETKGIQ